MNGRSKHLAVLVAALIVSRAAVADENTASPPVTEAIERALLASDWSRVLEECGADDRLASRPVLRLLKGHASLALNRNNEALALFLSATPARDREAWRSWCYDFHRRVGKEPISCLLLGDAEARMGQWPAAIRSYDTGLKSVSASHTGQPDLRNGRSLAGRANASYIPSLAALLHNSRGAAYAYQGEVDRAIKEFEEARRLAPSFCDAHANLGVALVRRELPEGARAAFKKALALCPDYGLAHNGLACAELGDADFKHALSELERAAQCAAVRALVNHNLECLVGCLMKTEEGDSGTKPGTTISQQDLQRQFKADSRKIDLLQNLKRIVPDDIKFNAGIGKNNIQIDYTRKTINNFLDKKIDAIKFDQNRLSQDAKRFNVDLNTKFQNPGGARTEDLAHAARGEWIGITWFGLAQRAEVPEKKAASRKGGGK